MTASKRKRKPRPKKEPKAKLSLKPHDRLFKAAMSDPARAGDLLRLVLPENMLAKLDLGALQVESGTWVDELLSESQSDILLSTRYGAEPVLVYVLLEHKSEVKRWAHLQMLGVHVPDLERPGRGGAERHVAPDHSDPRQPC